VDPVFGWVLRAALSLLFAAAAFHKLRAPREFAATVEAYALIPRRAVRPFAWALAVAEVGLAAAFQVPALGMLPSVAGAGLLGLYSGAIAVNLARGHTDIDCGCLGPALSSAQREPSLSAWLLVRNAALVGACLLLAAPQGVRPLVWVDTLSIAGGAAGIALCWTAAHHLATLPSLRRTS